MNRRTFLSSTTAAVAARLVDQAEIAVELLADRLVGNLERIVQQGADSHVGTSG